MKSKMLQIYCSSSKFLLTFGIHLWSCLTQCLPQWLQNDDCPTPALRPYLHVGIQHATMQEYSLLLYSFYLFITVMDL